ncbi:MAG: sigma-70 family RNA polymerase sigma factor [Planctomycetes bacterium]|nr:sigma-70 family RNA polymerase sigma factor [Planctomycetota bacterium]
MPPPPPEPGAVGPPEDWHAQLERLTPNLIAWTHVRLRGRTLADVEDLTQEILCRAVTRIDSYKGGDLAHWLFAIAKFVLLESLRRQRRDARVRLPQGHSSVYSALGQVAADMTTLTRKVARRDDLQHMLAMLDALDEVDREIATLCGMEGQTCRAVAARVGLGEEAVTKRWQRLRAKLKSTATWMQD